jgi:hypothetical protein
MRDFRDAKAMARTLRAALAARAFPDKIDHILSWLGMRRIRIE